MDALSTGAARVPDGCGVDSLCGCGVSGVEGGGCYLSEGLLPLFT
jgi:hypothetical protein